MKKVIKYVIIITKVFNIIMKLNNCRFEMSIGLKFNSAAQSYKVYIRPLKKQWNPLKQPQL